MSKIRENEFKAGDGTPGSWGHEPGSRSELADTAHYPQDSCNAPMPKIPPHMLRKIKVMERKKWVMKQLERLPFFR